MNIIHTLVDWLVKLDQFNVTSGYSASLLQVLAIALFFGLLGGGLFIMQAISIRTIAYSSITQPVVRILNLVHRLACPYPLSIVDRIASGTACIIFSLLLSWKIYQLTYSVFYAVFMTPNGNMHFEAAAFLASVILFLIGLYTIRRLIWNDTDKIIQEIGCQFDEIIKQTCQGILGEQRIDSDLQGLLIVLFKDIQYGDRLADKISLKIIRLKKIINRGLICLSQSFALVVCISLATTNILFGILVGAFFLAPIGYRLTRNALVIINFWLQKQTIQPAWAEK